MASRRAHGRAAGALTPDLVGIGLLVGGEGSHEPNIEGTLLAASVEGLERGDLRVLAVLVTWFGVHATHVDAERLTRLVGLRASKRVHAFWSALARWKAADRRFARLARGYRGPRLDLLSTGTKFHVARHSEDERFADSKLRVPANVLRDRQADVLQPAELASSHAAYRWRLVIGPTYRADMWAALETQPNLTAAALARATYGSIATALQVRRDFAAWRVASATPSKASPGQRVVGLRVRGRVYRAVLTPDLKVGGYTVEVPELPGCISEGDDLHDAKRMTREAIEAWFSVAGRPR